MSHFREKLKPVLYSYHIPDVTIYRLSRDDMQLRLCNRSQYPTNVRLLSIDKFITVANSKIEELERLAADSDKEKKSSSLVGHEICESPATQAANLKSSVHNALKEKVNASFQLPVESILLPARDDLAEYELTAPQNLKDDPKYGYCLLLLRSMRMKSTNIFTLGPFFGEEGIR